MRGISGFVVALTCAATAAWAQPRSYRAPDYNYPAYDSTISLGYDYYTGSGTSFSGGTLAYGNRFSRYLGFEVGGQYASLSGATLTNGYVVLQGFLPATNRLTFLASAGGAYASASASAGPFTVSTSEFGFRGGVGLDYALSRRFSVRTMYHYQSALADLSDISIGLAFHF
jgi:opacity protein-like surface antigen